MDFFGDLGTGLRTLAHDLSRGVEQAIGQTDPLTRGLTGEFEAIGNNYFGSLVPPKKPPDPINYMNLTSLNQPIENRSNVFKSLDGFSNVAGLFSLDYDPKNPRKKKKKVDAKGDRQVSL